MKQRGETSRDLRLGSSRAFQRERNLARRLKPGVRGLEYQTGVVHGLVGDTRKESLEVPGRSRRK